MTRKFSRRYFIGSLVASAGAAAMAKGKLGGPDLKVGILSDIHLSQPEKHQSQGSIDTFKKVLAFFKQEKVDAVLIAGDFTNDGTMTEMRVVVEAWKSVFGATGGPEKIWVTGNHERVYFDVAKRQKKLEDPAYADGLYNGIERNWQELFGEKWSPFFIKKVKGYAFVGAHWAEWWERPDEFRAFLAAHKKDLSASKPFFYTQHAHPQDTCYGKWTWHQWEGGPTTEILADYPNAVAFSGHTHYSITDARSVWQGAFTSIGTASLRWLAMPAGRENGVIYNGEGQRMGQTYWEPQGMVMSVWGDRMVFERYDFHNMEKLGDDWDVPVLHGAKDLREFSFENRRAKSKPPEFAADAKITVTEREGMSPKTAKLKPEKEKQVVVEFPAAIGADDLSRVFDYEVAAEFVEDDCVKAVRTKRVYQPGVQLNVKRISPTVTCVFGRGELPDAPFRFAVTPLNAFGQRGQTITCRPKLSS